MSTKMIKNHTGILNHLLVYKEYNETAKPIGYGYRVYYFNKEGSIRENHTLSANDDSNLGPDFYSLKMTSDDILIVVNRTVQ